MTAIQKLQIHFYKVIPRVVIFTFYVMQEIKETGGLKRLVALITDQNPPDEEPKGAKGEKKAGSRAAKKSAKDGMSYLINLTIKSIIC